MRQPPGGAHTSEAEGGASAAVRDARTAPEGRDSRLGAEQRSLRCAQPRTQGCPVRNHRLLLARVVPCCPESSGGSQPVSQSSLTRTKSPIRMLVNFTELLATALPRCSSAE